MTKDCLLNYKFSTWKFQAQNIRRTCCVHKLFWMWKPKQKKRTICVHNMFSRCSELGIFMYWTHNSMNSLVSYCGLTDAKKRASDKGLPVHSVKFNYHPINVWRLKLPWYQSMTKAVILTLGRSWSSCFKKLGLWPKA